MHCVCVVRSRSCRLPARNEKERKKKKREREGGKSDERRGSRQPFPLSPSSPPVGRGGSRGGGCVCARASRGGTTERRGQCLDPRRVFEGVSRGQSFAPPPANNLLVFHVRFDSLSFRYLYLPGPLRISGISGISRAGGWGALRGLGGGGRKKKEKIKGGKKQNVYTRGWRGWRNCARVMVVGGEGRGRVFSRVNLSS